MPDFGFPPLVGINANLLVSAFTARSALANASAVSSAAPQNTQKPDTSVPPPWDPAAKPLGQEEIVRKVLAQGVFFENDLGKFSDTSAPEDQKKLFALYSGVNRLAAIAADAADRTTTDTSRKFLQRRFGEGLAQLQDFLSATQFDQLSFLKDEKRSSADSAFAIDRGSSSFTTGVIQDGVFDDPVASLSGTVQFTITAKKIGGDVTVNLDLAEMGTTVRNLDNIASYINSKLAAAGLATTVKRVKIGTPDENGIIPGTQYGLEFTGLTSEPLSFSSPSNSPALFSVGVSGSGKDQASQLIRYDTQAGSAPTVKFAKRLETPEGKPAIALATATGANGEIYVLSQAEGSVGGLTPIGTQDVFLSKFDSTGKQVFVRGLGAAASASGLALKVAADGSVVVGGKVSGTLGTTTDLGGADAFVQKFDASGIEVFLKRFGGSGNEEVRDIALAADGSIYVAGRTTSGLSGAPQGGGNDGFVRKLAADGSTVYTRQFGGAGEEQADAIAIDGNGDLLVASTEDGIGKLRKYSAADGTSPALYTHDLGALDGGAINAITLDGTGILIAGTAGAANGLGSALVSHAGDRDGFVARIDETAGSPVRTYTTFVGTAGTDRIGAAVSNGGKIYLAGDTTGALPGGGVLDGTENAFTAVLDAATGTLEGSVQVSGRGGFSSAAGLSIDPQGASILDALGLPHGDVLQSDSLVVTDRSLARPEDSFFISVDGGPKHKIRIDSKDTYRSLTFKINAVTVLDGKADVVRKDNADVLRITPSAGHKIELFAGPEGQDLLKALGLPEGVVQADPALNGSDSASSAPPVYGLGLGGNLDLSTLKDAKSASDALQAALTTIRGAYRTLTLDPALRDLLNGKNKGLNGPVPQYLQSQLSNYSAGLARLQAGGSSLAGLFA